MRNIGTDVIKKRLLELIYPRSLFCNLQFTLRNRKIVVSCPVNSYNMNEQHVQNGGRKMALDDKLSKLRKENNLTQEQLADILGVPRQAVSKWKSDTAYPETDKLMQLSNIFSVSFSKRKQNTLPVIPDEPKEVCDPFQYLIGKTCDIQMHSSDLATFILSTDGYQKAVIMSVDNDSVQIQEEGAAVILNRRDIVGIVEA